MGKAVPGERAPELKMQGKLVIIVLEGIDGKKQNRRATFHSPGHPAVSELSSFTATTAARFVAWYGTEEDAKTKTVGR